MIVNFLAQLRSLDIKLWVEDGQLCYSAPRDALTPLLRAELAAHKAEILTFLQRAQASSVDAQPALVARVRSDAPMPLSFAQQRLWLLDQFAPGSPAYTIAVAVQLTGALHVAALERSLAELVRRHEALRTTFSVADDQPVQIVGAPWIPHLKIVDLSALSAAARDVEIQLLTFKESRSSFNLASGPLCRVGLIRLDPHEHILMLTMHHIVSDGWSMRVLIREVMTLYDACCADLPAPLPALPLQYADYAAWQREWLRGPVLERLLAYWREQLADITPGLQLPFDRPRPAIQTYRGANHYFSIPQSLTGALDALSMREGGTLFMTLLAAFQVLLARYSGQTDIVVGTPVANRLRVEVADLIGCFINTLVLRSTLADNSRFREVLAQVREVTLNGLAHQDMPLEKLVEELHPERDLSRSPFFNVLFDLQEASLDALRSATISARLLDVDNGSAKFDLSLLITKGAQEVAGVIRYNTDLFDGATIRRMARHLVVLLDHIAEDADQHIADLPILTAAEQQQLLVAWNDTQADYPQDACFHDLVSAQAAKTPHNTAVAFQNQRVSYADLDRRSNQFGHYLQTRGVGPNALVALCVAPGIDLLVGLLGILKAGAAYLPLDPGYPAARLSFMLSDSRAMLLVTQESLLARLPTYAGEIVCLDAQTLEQQPTARPVSTVTSAHLAYTLYTSGSTGQPKGVMITHRSLVNYLCWVNQAIMRDAVHSIPVITKLIFDASLKQLLAPLLCGREVWMFPDSTVDQPARLIHQLAMREHVGLNCVPALWRAMLEPLLSGHVLMPDEASFTLLLGGEQLNAELVTQSFEALPALSLWNVYGPTETTANASVAHVTSSADIAIGRPSANTQMYILDRRLGPVPIGVSGELYIGGAGLAQGYLNRPDLTAERFVPNPFATMNAVETQYFASLRHYHSSRLYKTGDLARYRPDGAIEYLGRIDQQIKLRGYRIELGEIAAVLEQHSRVRAAVVAVYAPQPDTSQLIAYVVPADDDRTDTIYRVRTSDDRADSSIVHRPSSFIQELRSFLQERLPDYMLPSAFVLLDALPLLPNGKIDRRALPTPSQGAPLLDTQSVAPRTAIEETLADIWKEVLGIARIGVYDNFFELGGHSLLATQVLTRVRKVFQVNPPLQALFEQPTIASLAAMIEADRPQSNRVEPAIKKAARRDQQVHAILSQLDQLSDSEAQELLRRKKLSPTGESSHE